MKISFALALSGLLLPLATAAEIPKGSMQLVTKNPGGFAADGPSAEVAISGNGRDLAVTTLASNLAVGSFNGFEQVALFSRDGQFDGIGSKMKLGHLANLDCGTPKLDKKGRVLAFTTRSAMGLDFVPTGKLMVYRRDLVTGTIELATIGFDGEIPAADCELRDLSDDGRFVLFATSAGGMAPGVGGGVNRVYLRDCALGTTEVVSMNDADQPLDGGVLGARLSGDGRFVTFSTAAANAGAGGLQIYVRDLAKGRTKLLSRAGEGAAADGDCHLMAVSRNARFVLFRTMATNLVAGLDGDDYVVFDAKKKRFEKLEVVVGGYAVKAIYSDSAISNSGKKIFLDANIAPVGSPFGVHCLVEIDRAKDAGWPVIVKDGAAVATGYLDFESSANGKWLVFSTDAALLESNGMIDGYVYRSH